MCGIVGEVGPSTLTAERLRAMRDRLRHRGPDAEGEHMADGVYLGSRRLRIIDLVTGDQPIANEDGTVWTVHNGEVYNFRALRDVLIDRGHRFRTRSDTEVIVHGYEEFGVDLPTRLEGMFAFAVWDSRRRSLLLARDRLGKKPLLYGITRSGSLVFGSELAALVAHPGVRRDLDPEALDLYLSLGYIPAPLTAFRGIRKLPPGHRLVWQEGHCSTEPYWRPPERHGTRAIGEREAVAELTHLAREAVRARLISDVPIGAYLSGGVDSSFVVALMANEIGRVRTFSVGFEEAGYSELAHARRVAERYSTEHHEIVVRPDVAEIAPLLARHYGEPYADSSAVPTYYLAQLARAHVTVSLNGDGGDEAFAGYDRYRAMRMAERLVSVPSPIRTSLLKTLGRLVPRTGSDRGTLGRARRFVEGAALPRADRYLSWIGIFTEDEKRALLSADARPRASDGSASRRLEAAMAGQSDPADAANAADLRLYLPDDLLAKVDIASMANSLEVRSPLLDRTVVEFGASLPIDLKIRGGLGKHVLKRAAEPFVPRENLYRPKMGFGVPIGTWFRGELRGLLEDTILSPQAARRGMFRPEAVRGLVDEHIAGRADRSRGLWALVMLELWQRELHAG
ncbi:MAG: asparagine synthase (glutamine-hydrolyzing) [Elusimicrobia bacterium]|nr:asparagine synthase (glutamine-hydrolyzing) [Elusimicrobiota bacterium]